MGIKFATDETVRLPIGDDGFIEVRKDMSKREFNALMAAMPNREISQDSGLTLQEGLTFQNALFEALVVGWSATEPATVENYLRTNRETADTIDKVLIEHFGAISPTVEETSKAPSSRGKARKEPLPRV